MALEEVVNRTMVMVITVRVALTQVPGARGGGEHGEREHILFCQGHLLSPRGDWDHHHTLSLESQ